MTEIQKTAAFLADCLSNMPPQPEQVQSAVDTVIAGLKLIADGGEWPKDEALAVAWADARVEASYHGSMANAAYVALRCAVDWVRHDEKYYVEESAGWVALSHPDLDAERARQEKVRNEWGI